MEKANDDREIEYTKRMRNKYDWMFKHQNQTVLLRNYHKMIDDGEEVSKVMTSCRLNFRTTRWKTSRSPTC